MKKLAHEFVFHGGVVKPSTHAVEKFLLFFVVGGKEVPFHQLRQDGLIQQVESGKDRFLTGLQVGKIFLAQQGFGIPRRYHSFYFHLIEGPSELVTILPFAGRKVELKFQGKIRFLNKTQILALLDPSNQSRGFVERQVSLPLDVLKSLISVEKATAEDVRHVRIGKRKKKTESLTGLPMAED